jgi:hypothetical protein
MYEQDNDDPLMSDETMNDTRAETGDSVKTRRPTGDTASGRHQAQFANSTLGVLISTVLSFVANFQNVNAEEPADTEIHP